MISIGIAIKSYFDNTATRKLVIPSFRRAMMEPYLTWRSSLGTIELDPPPDLSLRVYDAVERRKIRDYWPRVAKVELEILNSSKNPKKDIPKIYQNWERLLLEGLSHRSILQEFCYYSKYEDRNDPTKQELVKTVEKIYSKAHHENIDIEFILLEREKHTKPTLPENND